MSNHVDVAIVGGGIIGIAHAWRAARDGLRVVVFERNPRAIGASIRNFGMIWPIGQPAGQMHDIAMTSRNHWREVAREAGIWLNECGSIHLAHRADELRVLEEFRDQARHLGYECEVLTPRQVEAQSPGAKPDGLLGGLWSPSEACVDPREALRVLPLWLAEAYQVQFKFATIVHHIDASCLKTSRGEIWQADRIIVAGGSDFETLFPDVFATSGMTRCKLQMLRTTPQRDGWRIGPHLASGLTLRHYQNFSICPSIDAFRRRVAEETPELDRWGIHVMAAQNQLGEVILGDSHEYDDSFDPICRREVDELMLRELRRVVQLNDWSIAERWFGIYAKHPTSAFFEYEPQSGVEIITGLGGAGMTLSFGLADARW